MTAGSARRRLRGRAGVHSQQDAAVRTPRTGALRARRERLAVRHEHTEPRAKLLKPRRARQVLQPKGAYASVARYRAEGRRHTDAARCGGRDALGGSPGHAEGERTRAWLSTAAQACSGADGLRAPRAATRTACSRASATPAELHGAGRARRVSGGPLTRRAASGEQQRSGAAATDAHLEATCARHAHDDVLHACCTRVMRGCWTTRASDARLFGI